MLGGVWIQSRRRLQNLYASMCRWSRSSLRRPQYAVPSDPVLDEPEQPTLAEKLQSVHMCTASGNTIKDQFHCLWEEVSLLRQDLQKIRERTIAVESRVNDIKDKRPLLVQAHTAHQLAKENNRAHDMENHLRCNNFGIVGLLKRKEGPPTTFVESWLMELFW